MYHPAVHRSTWPLFSEISTLWVKAINTFHSSFHLISLFEQKQRRQDCLAVPLKTPFNLIGSFVKVSHKDKPDYSSVTAAPTRHRKDLKNMLVHAAAVCFVYSKRIIWSCPVNKAWGLSVNARYSRTHLLATHLLPAHKADRRFNIITLLAWNYRSA